MLLVVRPVDNRLDTTRCGVGGGRENVALSSKERGVVMMEKRKSDTWPLCPSSLKPITPSEHETTIRPTQLEGLSTKYLTGTPPNGRDHQTQGKAEELSQTSRLEEK